jgi:hypothetical protein
MFNKYDGIMLPVEQTALILADALPFPVQWFPL